MSFISEFCILSPLFDQAITLFMTKSRLSIYALLLFLVGFAVSSFWHSLHNPMKPLFVEVLNQTDKLIPSVVIEHGKSGLQEKIMLLQLAPQESRTIALNHNPGMGFNVLVNFADGEKTEICGGKSKDHWFFRETITDFGIYTTPIR